ncbi:MAG: carboxypeptidase regulatory-like domain-containing protein [Acidobacteriia bacterium]|nr:carboxypeptidase regulatory-like domain-containing protein [Terriglobia bacterium]
MRFALFISAIAACLAQSNTATISGAITDAHGAVIAGSVVMAISDATGIRATVKTNDSGFYVIPDLPIGGYSLTVEKQGFRRYVHSGLILTTSMILELNATLELGAVTEIVNVTALEPLVNTRTSAVTDVIDPKSIEDLPLINRRTMGILRTSGLAAFIGNDNLPTYSLAGGRVQSQMVWIDGGTGQNIRVGPGQQNVDPPVETIQEIKILANNYPAEYGGSAGGVVIETTKSGTNQLHGSAYEYLRNDAMDAPGFFATVSNGAKIKPELRYNVFGTTAGGPIRRNRTFFFGAYEGTRRRTGSTTTLTVPTEIQRNGDFSQTFNSSARLIPIYDPDMAPRQAFPDNVIPKNRLDPVAMKLLNYFPHANRAADTIAGANNFRANNVTAVTGDFLAGKVDHSLDEKNRLTGRYIRYRQNTDPSSVYPDPGADPATHNRGGSQYLYGSWTHILSATSVNDLRYTYVNRRSHVISSGVGGDYPRKIGLIGVDQLAFPQFQLTGGYSPLGSAAQERRQNPIEQHQLLNNLTWLRGRHALKFGYEARFSHNHDVNLATPSGRFVFGAENTGFPSNASTGNGLASLLLGLPTSFNQTVVPALDRHSWYLAGFAQDDWAVSTKLTLNAGMRWELDTPLFDSNLRMNGFDPRAINPISGTPGVVKFAGVGGYPQHPYRFDWNNFGPRFGFAWEPLGPKNAVIRGGYGIFFAHPFDNVETTAASLGFSLSATINTVDGITAPFLLRNGVPPVTPPSPALDDAFGAVRLGQSTTTPVSYFERDRVSGYSHQFNLTVQRQLPGSIVLEAGFLGNLGRKLPSADLSINQVPPQILGPAHHSQADRPFPQFSDVVLLAPSFGISNYCAGLFKVEKRLSRGLNLMSGYTWSKFLGNTNDTANPGAEL